MDKEQTKTSPGFRSPVDCAASPDCISDGSRPISPAKRLPKSRWPIHPLTPCGRITTPRKSIGNWARLRNAPGIRPGRKSAPRGVRPRAALGGFMCGACAPPLTLAPLAAGPSARRGCEWKDPRAAGGALPPPGRPPLRAGRPARSPTKTRAPLHQSPQMNIPVLLTTKNSCFENYATYLNFRVAILRAFPILHPA